MQFGHKTEQIGTNLKCWKEPMETIFCEEQPSMEKHIYVAGETMNSQTWPPTEMIINISNLLC